MKNIVLFGAVISGLALVAAEPKLETEIWQGKIDAAAANGGGRVVVPAGRHVTGQLYLKSGVELHLEEGASLEGAPGSQNYKVHVLPYSEGDWMAVVMAIDQHDVAITGKGEVFGNGKLFEKRPLKNGCNEGLRPRGIFFANCRNIRLEDFTLRDAASWGIVLKCCDGMVARRVKIDSNANHNNDGFDIEAKNVLIEDCDVDSGDDAYCIKSNTPDYTVENITVRNCIARSHCNGYKIGTASHGTIRNIRFEHCRSAASRRVYRDLAPMPTDLTQWAKVSAGVPKYLTGAGIGVICIECVDGGIVEDIVADDIDCAGFQVPFFVRGGTRTGRKCGTPPNHFYILRNVTISNIRGRAEHALACSVTGVKGCRPQGITLRNINLECLGENGDKREIKVPGEEIAGAYPEATMFRNYRLPAYGLFVDQADDVKLENVNFTIRKGSTDEREQVYLSKK